MHLTTLSPAAFVGDVALIWLLWVGTSDWPDDQATLARQALLSWMLFSKFIKLVTHFVRYPVDIFLWPISILFGWCHGIIKFYAMVTLNEVRASLHSGILASDPCSFPWCTCPDTFDLSSPSRLLGTSPSDALFISLQDPD